MTARKVPKAIAILGWSRRINDLPALARTIVLKMTGNAYFPSPKPTLAAIMSHVKAFESAQTVALTRVKGGRAARDVKKNALLDSLLYLLTYVQQIASADPANAEAIITSAGMCVKGDVGRRQKQLLAAIQGPTSGSVHVVARAVARLATYYWQWSLDRATWNDLESTLQADTWVHNLTPRATYYFRFRATTSKGPGDWSQIVSLFVR